MVDAAREALPQLPSLKTLRIMRIDSSAEDYSSFDVVCDLRYRLPPNTDWTAIEIVKPGEDYHHLDGSEKSTA